MSVLAVANQSSGGADEEVLEEVRTALAPLGDVRMLIPHSLDDFAREVSDAARASNLVVVIGGDGTFNRAVNALAERFDDLVFGLVPTGTGNDFARTLELPEDPVEAASALVHGRERAIDVGRARGRGVDRLFVNACMGGFPVDVNQAIDPDLKRRVGPLAFWIGGAKAAADLTRFRAVVNGVVTDDCVALGVGNGKTCGGGIRVWPNAEPDDRLLDVCALPAKGVTEGLRLAAKVRGGGHVELADVRTARGRELEVTTEPAVEFNVDGELMGLETPARFELIQRLRMRVPA